MRAAARPPRVRVIARKLPFRVLRSAVIFRPNAPFLKWIRETDSHGIAPESSEDGEQTIYLIPEADDDHDLERILKKLWSKIFEMELEGWHLDESAWPKKRSLEMFKEWFIIEYHSVVEDMGDGPVREED